MRPPTRIVAPVLLICLATTTAGATDPPSTPDGPLVVPRAAVAADHPLASRIGVEVLQAGGNAADAAVAVGLALGVVNAFASGIGGGGFLLWRGHEDTTVRALDFREVAPACATEDMFVVDGEVDRQRALFSPHAVAVPGEVAGWWALHEAHGRLPWADVVAPAVSLARDGFTVGELLPFRLQRFERLRQAPSVTALYLREDGEWVEQGDTLTLPELGRALASIADEGPDVFYRGWIAQDIVNTLRDEGGCMTLEDLAAYSPRWVDPVVTPYREYTVYGMSSPSSSGIVLGAALRFLERFELRRLAWEDAITAHLILQALTHAFADRASFHGDDRFVDVPWPALVAPERINGMHRLWNPARIHDAETYGWTPEEAADEGTSHFSIIDEDGNSIAVTVTVNTSFGSLIRTPESGIFLNNEMNDFSGQPGTPNIFGLIGTRANAIAPGKAPLSSMSPLIVERDGELVGTLGGSGGPRIISGTLLVFLQVADFDRDVWHAVTTPRLHHQWMPFVAYVEEDGPHGWIDGTPHFGYEVQVQRFGNAVQAIWTHPDGWQAMSDPRKRGAPAGY